MRHSIPAKNVCVDTLHGDPMRSGNSGVARTLCEADLGEILNSGARDAKTLSLQVYVQHNVDTRAAVLLLRRWAVEHLNSALRY